MMGRNVSTISRELNRNRTYMNVKPAYYPHTAQKKCNLRRSYCHRGMFWDKEVLDYIDEKLQQTWSPEQISKTPCELKMLSFKPHVYSTISVCLPDLLLADPYLFG